MPLCNWNLTAELYWQSFTTPEYPANYLMSLSCSWLLVAPPGQKVLLQFVDFDTERIDHYRCKDTVYVYNGMLNT